MHTQQIPLSLTPPQIPFGFLFRYCFMKTFSLYLPASVMPTAKRVLVQLSRRHTWNLKGEYSIAPERIVPGGCEQLPGLGCGRGRGLNLVPCPPTPNTKRKLISQQPSTKKKTPNANLPGPTAGTAELNEVGEMLSKTIRTEV